MILLWSMFLDLFNHCFCGNLLRFRSNVSLTGFFENGLLPFNMNFIIVRALSHQYRVGLKTFTPKLYLYVNRTLAIFCYCWLLIWQSILYPGLGHVMMKHTWRGKGWSTLGHDCAVPWKLVLWTMQKTKPYTLPLETVFCGIREKLVHFPAFVHGKTAVPNMELWVMQKTFPLSMIFPQKNHHTSVLLITFISLSLYI